MRNIQIYISARPGTSDNTFSFVTNSSQSDPNQEAQVYEFISMDINYFIQSSNVLSQIIFSMNVPVGPLNVIRSGQIVQISDEGNVVFEGIIVPSYSVLPVSDNGTGGVFLVGTLLPSICQLASTPMVFDTTQANQINSLLGISIINILAGGVAQNVSTSDLLSYIITNTDYNTTFQKTIIYGDLPETVFLMASAGQSRDAVVRASIDFTNTVMYQAENGTIIIRQLNSSLQAPFSLDLSNSLNGEVSADGTNKLQMLQYKYSDNAISCPSVISNYGLLAADPAISADVQSLLVTYTPNPTYFPRVQQLQKSGWFVGSIMNSQINNNIVTDPTVASILKNYQAFPDKYMLSAASLDESGPTGFVTAYQSLLTGKQLGHALTTYAGLECVISLDDPNIPSIGMTDILGTCVNIGNCDLKSGLIAAYKRSYSAAGSFLALNIVPLGSITGYWSA